MNLVLKDTDATTGSTAPSPWSDEMTSQAIETLFPSSKVTTHDAVTYRVSERGCFSIRSRFRSLSVLAVSRGKHLLGGNIVKLRVVHCEGSKEISSERLKFKRFTHDIDEQVEFLMEAYRVVLSILKLECGKGVTGSRERYGRLLVEGIFKAAVSTAAGEPVVVRVEYDRHRKAGDRLGVCYDL